MTGVTRCLLIFVLFNKCLTTTVYVYVEEDTAVNLTCTFPGALNNYPAGFIRWRYPSNYYSVNSSSPVLSTCSLHSGLCNNNYGHVITAEITSNSSGDTVSILSIFNVSRMLYPSLFGNRQNYVWECDLSTDNVKLIQQNYNFMFIFVSPQPLLCDFQVVNQTTVTVSCVAERVYPQYQCYESISMDNVTFKEYTGERSYDNILRNETNENYSFWCNVTWTMFYLGIDNYLKVYFYTTGFSMYSDIFTITPEALRDHRDENSAKTNSQESSKGLVTGLAVATGLCAGAAVVLAVILLVCCRLRSKQSKQGKDVTSEPTIRLKDSSKSFVPEGNKKPANINLNDQSPESGYEIVERIINPPLPAINHTTNPVNNKGYHGPYTNVEGAKQNEYELPYEN